MNKSPVGTLRGMTTFSVKLRKLLRVNDITQTRLAQTLGFSISKVNDWCKGRTFPRLDEAAQISELLGCSVDYLAVDSETHLNPNNITKDEKVVLDVYRSLGISAKEAVQALASARLLDGREERVAQTIAVINRPERGAKKNGNGK